MAMTMLDLRIERERGIRFAGIEGMHERSVMCVALSSWMRSIPIVGWPPLVPITTSIDGPNGLDVSSSSIGVVASAV